MVILAKLSGIKVKRRDTRGLALVKFLGSRIPTACISHAEITRHCVIMREDRPRQHVTARYLSLGSLDALSRCTVVHRRNCDTYKDALFNQIFQKFLLFNHSSFTFQILLINFTIHDSFFFCIFSMSLKKIDAREFCEIILSCFLQIFYSDNPSM